MDVARAGVARKRKTHRMIIGAGGLAAMAVITVGLSRLKPAVPTVDRASVFSGVVQRGSMLREVRGSGKLVPEVVWWIPATTARRVERILVFPGASVQGETVLLELSNAELDLDAVNTEWEFKSAEAELLALDVMLQNELLALQAAVARVAADYQDAMLREEIDKQLFADGLISERNLKLSRSRVEKVSTLDEIERKRLDSWDASQEARLAVQRSRVEQARALHNLKRAQVETLRVRAGTDGVLEQMPVEVGQRVARDTILAKVTDPNTLKAVLRIPETQARDVVPGLSATIDTRNGLIAGRVARIDPAVQDGSVSVDVALVGLIVVLQSTPPHAYSTLEDGGSRATMSRRSRRIRHRLTIGEIALGLTLLAGAGLMIQSVLKLQRVNPGFRSDGVFVSQIVLPGSLYDDGEAKARFFEQVVRRLEAMPGITEVAGDNTLPLQGSEEAHEFHEAGKPPASAADVQVVAWDTVLPGYFKTLGIPLLRGRTISALDDATAQRVVVIDEAMARRYWPDEDPIGRRISITSRNNTTCEIIGIVGSVRHEQLEATAQPRMYVAFAQDPTPSVSLTIRSALNTSQVASMLRSTVGEIDPDQTVSSVHPLSRYVANALAHPRFIMSLLGVFAALGLVLAAVGIYGVMACSVAQRTNEIGIRIALGAQIRDILRLVLSEGSRLVGFGVAVGLGCALILTRLLSGVLYGVEPTDSIILLEVSLLLGTVALMACSANRIRFCSSGRTYS